MIHAQPTADDAHGARVGEILNEYFDRRSRGDGASVDDLLAAHPDLADELRAGFDVLGDLGVSPSRIDSLIRHGVLTKSSEAEYPAELGPYQIVGLIGSGGMGIVLEAREPRLDRTVAIKILKPELADNAGLRLRFVREAKSAAALKHAHIVGIHAVGESAGVPYIVMEHVSGPTLADVIRGDGRLSTEFIRAVLGQLLDALSAAHEAGLIHRDVKPSNVLLVDTPRRAAGFSLRGAARAEARGSSVMEPDKGGTGILESSNPGILPTIKLADFGLARMQDSQTQLTMTQAVLGTPEYMSPEQARGDADIDQRTDLYSAGVVLYEMLTGRTPFRADTPSATLRRILDEEPRDPRKLDKAVDPVLASLALRLMAKRREDRFESAGEASAALNIGRVVRYVGVRRRGRPSAVVLAVTLGLVAAAAIWWSTRGGDGAYVMLFNEDWPTDQVDADKWDVWGDPLPVLHDGRWKGAYSLDPGGDDWCPSGVNGREKFDLRRGFRLSWSAIVLASEKERGLHDLSLLVGIASTRADGGICGSEGRKQKLITLFTVADVNDAYWQVGGDAVQGKQRKLPYERSEDAEWYRYTMVVDARGRLTLTRGNEVLASASVDTALLGECVLVVEGRSKGRSGKRDIAVDDIDLMGRR